MSISPQGYNLGADPKNKNPFWGQGEDSDVNAIYADASVDNSVGTPSVSVTKIVSGHDITFDFAFHNLKGVQGQQGIQGPIGPIGPIGATGATGRQGPAGADGSDGADGADGFSPVVDVVTTTGGHMVSIQDSTHTETFTVLDGEAGQGVPEGGTTGQVLAKKSDDDYDTEWVDPSGGGASGNIGWGDYGPEEEGRYPRGIKLEYKLVNGLVVHESGTGRVYFMGSHTYNYTISGILSADFIVGNKYTPEMTPGASQGMYTPTLFNDVSEYLTATITPQDQMTVDNIRVSLSSLYEDSHSNSLEIMVSIDFDAHFSGQDDPGNATTTQISAPDGEWSKETTYAYLEILQE